MFKKITTVAALIVAPGLLIAGAAPTSQKDISTNTIGDPEISGSATAWSIFEAQNPGVGKLQNTEGRVERIFGPAFSTGNSAKASADAFVAANAGMWGINGAELLPIGPFASQDHIVPLMNDRITGIAKFELVAYTPHINGVPVYDSAMRLLVRNEPGFPLVLASVQIPNLDNFQAPVGFGPAALNQKQFNSESSDWFEAGSVMSGIRPVIFAGVSGVSQTPRAAVEFTLTGNDAADGGYSKWTFITDPNTGEIFHSANQILHADVEVEVVGNVTDGPGGDECHPETLKPIPYARVTVGGSAYVANEQGIVTIPNSGSGSVSVVAECRTNWFNVTNEAGSDHTVSAVIPSGGSAQMVLNSANSSALVRAEANGIFYAEQTRNFTLDYAPFYPQIGGQTNWTVNVNIGSSCNAYYDGSSINMYQAGGGCGNTAAGAIIIHEYGHHLVNVAGSGQSEYGEGYGDSVGVIMTGENRLGLGFYQGNCTSGIRDANNSCTYSASGCSSCGSAIHSCGQLLSGMVWDVRENLLNAGESEDIINAIVINSVLLHGGTSINEQIVIDWLTLDDNDGNINNGTPNYQFINDGCSVHGLSGPELDFISFSFPSGTPETLDPNTGGSFPVSVTGLSATPVAGSGTLSFRIDGAAWNQVNMSGSGNTYTANIPASECGSVVDFYVSAQATNGVTYDSAIFTALSASGLVTAFDDDFDSDLGWSVVNDSALTDGAWNRGPTEGPGRGQAGSASSGVNCYSTDNATGNSDVDGGCTSLLSPAMDASAPGSILSYSRWYDNTGSNTGADPSNDIMQVDISNNGGFTWISLETIGPNTSESSGGWFDLSFVVSDVINPTDQIRVRFTVCDADSATQTGSVIEAAVDRVQIEAVDCGDVEVCNGDLNGDFVVNGADLGLLLSSFGVTGENVGDLNGDLVVNGADLGLMLSAFGDC
jgi:hypothetical protein